MSYRPHAVVLLLLIAAGVSRWPTEGSTTAPPPGPEPQAPPGASAPKQSVPTPLMRLCDSMDRQADRQAPPASRSGVCGATFDWVIATVPDPDRTNLQLMFDRHIESILRAAEDEGYSFDRHWLPWQAGAQMPDDATLNDPGILLFRPAAGGSRPLAVLLVGETPTSGINAVQFENARNFASRNRPAQVRIAGPSFSGSFDSLLQLTSDNPSGYRVVTGTATDSGSRRKFRCQVNDFTATVHTDDTIFRTLFQFIEGTWEHAERVAILAEADTAYGHQFQVRSQTMEALRTGARPAQAEAQPCADTPEVSAGDFRMHVVRYPRNISRLRNAYRDTQKPADASSQAQPSPAFTFKDPENPADTLPQFAPVHTPASQEAILSEIASTIRRENIRYAIVTATNTLDLLFLSRYLRVTCPDVRLIISEGDLLFSHGAEAYSYSGIVSASTYALMTVNQHWSSPTGFSPKLTSFSDGFSQGVYNAVRILLHPAGRPDLPSYASPFIDGRIPPVWVTAVGAAGYFPIAALQPQYDKHQDPALYQAPEPVESGWTFFVASPPVLWIALFTAAILLSWMLIVVSRVRAPSRSTMHLGSSFYRLCLHLVLIELVGLFTLPASILLFQAASTYISFAGVAAISLPLAIAAVAARQAREPQPGPSRQQTRKFILATACAILVILLVGDLGLGERRFPVWAAGCTLFGYATTAALLWSGVRPLLPALDRHSPRGNRLRRALGRTYGFPLLLAGIVVAATVASVAFALFAPGHGGLFVAFRSLVFASGVSPLPSTLLLLIGLGAWSAAQMKRVLLTEQRCSILPELTSGPLTQRMTRVRVDLDHVIARPLHRIAIPAVLAVIATAVVAPFVGDHQTLEPRAYENLLVILFFVSATLNVLAWMGMLQVWGAFRRFLQLLDGHPVRTAFDSVRTSYTWTPIWKLGLTGRDDILLTRSVETLRQISAKIPENPASAEVRRLLGSIEGAAGRAAAPLEMRRIQSRLTAAASLLAPFLDAHWSRGRTPRLLDDKTLEPSDPEYVCSLIQHFLGLRFLTYILYVQSHMQMLLASTVALFVTSLIALNVYPFLAQERLGWTWMLFFLAYLIATGIVFAQMDKDPVFSRLTGSQAGKLDWEFGRRMLAWGALPLLSVVASQSHSMAQWIYRWVVPTLEAIR